MTRVTIVMNGVAPFPMRIFRSHSEFESYLADSDSTRGLRWLHERSLASTEKTVSVSGTCGLCLAPTTFTAWTRGGDPAPNGWVPNWREGLLCGCERRLINRQRALLHFLAAEGLLRSWTRILLLGDAAALHPVLTEISSHVTHASDPLEVFLDGARAPQGGYHLILSIEQLTARSAHRENLSAFAGLLAPGGTLAFTAPFAVNASGDPPADEGPVDWGVLAALRQGGFYDARVCGYWSEEFGYLGAFNVIIAGSRL